MPAFPAFSAGESVHLPYRQEWDVLNASNKMPHGYQYAYNLRAAAVKRWEINFSLSDVDLATLKAFWDTVKGAYDEFTFTDPDTAVTTAKCRFEQDALDTKYVGPNENLVMVQIQEYV